MNLHMYIVCIFANNNYAVNSCLDNLEDNLMINNHKMALAKVLAPNDISYNFILGFSPFNTYNSSVSLDNPQEDCCSMNVL